MTVAEPTPAAAPVHERFTRLGRRKSRRWIPLLILAVLIAAGAGAFAFLRKPAAPVERYITAAVSVGDLAQSVETTGTVQPLVQVQVSSQVSGRVSRVLVDFNSRVHQGDLIAELDTTPFRAQLEQARGSLISAQGNLSRAEADLANQERLLARATQLLAANLNAQADVDLVRGARDTARGARDASRGSVVQARAALTSAQTNLNLCRIIAPIDGIVITRSVDPGATVAASLSAPTLFVIANDMLRMQVLADIQEAYVGRLSAGLGAEVRVDAFRGEVFRGSVREVRFAPTTVSGVVTYPAVIEVDNPSGKLRPGMTATITIATARAEHVLLVPNAALRFRPSGATARTGGARGGRDGGVGAATGGAGGVGGAAAREVREARADATPRAPTPPADASSCCATARRCPYAYASESPTARSRRSARSRSTRAPWW